MAAGAVSLKKPHYIITLRFSEVVNDHAKYERSRSKKKNLDVYIPEFIDDQSFLSLQ